MRYAVTGPYCDVNYGDYAMLPNNLAVFPTPPDVVFVFDDGFTSGMLCDYGLKSSTTFIQVQVAATAIELDATSAVTPLELLQHVVNLDDVREAVERMDILVVNGGGYINDLWAQPHRMVKLVSILAPVMVAAQLGKPVRFTANGFGPFTESADFFASLLGRIQNLRITCRDNIGSAGWLRRLGVDENAIRQAPDDLLVMADLLKGRTPRWTAATQGEYIVVETYRPMPEVVDNMQPLLALQESLGCEVVLLPMNRGHGGEEQARVLAKTFPRAHLYPISSVGYLPVEDALEAMRGARLVVTDRYHGLVTALAVSATVTSVIRPVRGSLDYYYRKNAGALQWRLDPNTYHEADFIRLAWADLPSTADALSRLDERQQETYRGSGKHFEVARSARFDMIKETFNG